MPSNTIDWDALVEELAPTNKPIESHAFDATTQHRFTKVAFDTYREVGQPHKLWELREGEDGKKYLFALYGDDENTLEATTEPSDLPVATASTTAPPWTAQHDRAGQNITLFLDNTPVYRFAHTAYGFKTDEAPAFADFVCRKATQDKTFISKLAKFMPEDKATWVLGRLGLTRDGE